MNPIAMVISNPLKDNGPAGDLTRSASPSLSPVFYGMSYRDSPKNHFINSTFSEENPRYCYSLGVVIDAVVVVM